jgi:H+/gluconate symporter-like permease
MSLLIVLASLCFLMSFAYRAHSVISFAPIVAFGAVFGKVIELSSFSKSIVSSIISPTGRKRAMLSIVAVSGLLTYGGVSLFVIQNIIPPMFFETNIYYQNLFAITLMKTTAVFFVIAAFYLTGIV